MGWFMPKGFRTKQRSSVAGGRLPVSRVQPVVEKLEDRTAPAVALFNAGTLSLQLANNEALTLQNGLSVGTQLNLVSNQNIDYSQLPSGMVATVVSASNITLNLDLVNDDVNHLLVDFGSASGGLASFGDFKPSSLLNVTVQDATGASGNQLQFSKSLDLTSANGNFSANLLGTSVSLNGSLKTGKGTIQIADQLAGSALTVSSTASPQLEGSTISLDFRGEIGNAANPLKVRVPSPGLLQVVTQNYSANLQAVGSVKIGKLDLGTGTATLRGAYTSVADSIGDGTTLNMALNALLIVGGQDTIGGLSGPGQVSLGANTLTLAMTGARTFDGILSGTAALNLTGAGTQTLTGSNTFSGSVAISPSSGLVIGSGVSGDLPASTFQNEGTLTFSRTGTLDVAGQIRGAGSVAYAGGATYQVSGANDYTGGTSVTGNTVLVVKNSSALGGSSGKVLVGNGSSLVLNGSIGNLTIGNAIQVQGQGVSPYQALHNLAGNNRVTGGLTLTGATSIGREAGTSLELAGGVTGAQKADLFGQGTLILSKQSTSSTQYIVHAGTVVARASGSTGTGSVEVMTGAGLVLDGTAGDITLGSALTLNGNGQGNSGVLSNIAGNNAVAGKVTMASGSLFSTAGGTGLTLKGGVAESAKNTALTLAGTGTLNLSATGSYTGVTTVQGGTLAIQADDGAGTGTIDVQAGASLKLEGGSQIGNPIRVVGAGVGGKGAIQASGKDNVATGSIQLLGNTTIGLMTPDTVLFADGIISESSSGTSLGISGPDGAEMYVTAANTYTGSTSVSGAALVLGDGTSNGSISSQSIVLSDNGGLAVLRTDSPANPFNLQAVISGAGGFAVYGGNVLLSAANTYTGNTEVWAGTSLVVGPTGSIASSSLINVMGALEFQQSGSVVLAGKLEGTAPGSIVFGGGGSYLVGQDGTFSGQIQVDSSSRLTVNGDVPDASVNLDGTLDGTGTVGQIQAGTGSMLMPGVSGAGVLTSSSLSFPGSGSQFVTSVRDDGSNLVSTILTVTGAGQVDLNNTELVIQSTQPLNSVGTILYLVDFTGGGSVQSNSYFTDSLGGQILEGETVEIAPGLGGTLLYHFGPDGNDVVLLIAQNYSTFTYDATTGSLELELGQDTNLTASDSGNSDIFQLTQAASSQVIWVQFGGDPAPAGSTPTKLVIQPGLAGDVTIRQRGSVATGTNLVTLDGLNLAGGMSISLDQGAVNAVSIGANGLGVAGGLIVETSLGSITQTGNLTIGGTADLTAMNDIVLARAGNDFGAAVSAKASGKIQLSDAGNLSTGKLSALRAELVAGGSIETGATSVTDLTLQSGGALTQASGTALNVSGLATLSTTGAANLGSVSNNFDRLAVQKAGSLNLVDLDTLTLVEAGNLTGGFDLKTLSGNLLISVPGSKIAASGDIRWITSSGNKVSVMGSDGLVVQSVSGGIDIDSGLLDVVGNSLTLTAAKTVTVPLTQLVASTGSANILIDSLNANLQGDLSATGEKGASVEIQAVQVGLGRDIAINSIDASNSGNEQILLDGDVVELAGSTDLTMTAARIEVTGKLGSPASPLGDLSLTGGTEIGGAIDLAGKLVLEDKVSKTANLFLGAIHAGSMEVISAVSSLEFRGLVQLSGTGVFSGISSQGIKFNDQLTAQTLAFNSGLVSYPVTLFGSAQTTDSLVAARFDNGGATRLGDDAKDQFHFAGGLNQTGALASILAVGTILTDGTPVNLTRLEAAGLPLVIDTTGGSSAPAAITIQGPAQVVPGLTLRGSTSTFSGNSVLTPGIIGVPTGTLQLGAGISGFAVGGTVPGNSYTQFRTNNGVTLSGAKLSVDLGVYAPPVGTVFTLVENTGSSAVTGTFDGLPEGSTYRVGDTSFLVSYAGGTGDNDITLRVVRTVPIPDGPVVAQPFNLEAGSLVAGVGRGQVRLEWFEGVERQSQVITPFPFYTGSVNLATVDRSGDGVADAVVAMVASGGAPSVVVIDSATGRVALSFFAFAPQFLGGGTVAGGIVNLGGEVNSVIAIGAGKGAEPSVTVFDAIDGTFIQAFYAYSQQYVGGVAVAFTAPDANQNSLIIAASSINSHVTLFDLNAAQQAVASFYAFSPSSAWQPISVAGGVFTGADNKPFQAIVVGAAPGWASSVAVFDIRGLAQKAFYAFNPAFTGGVRVGVGDVNRDGRLEIMAGSGPGSTGTLNIFDYNTLNLIDALFISDTTQGVTLGSNLTV